MKLEIQITKTEVFEKLLLSQSSAIQRLAEGLSCLAEGDLPGTQSAMQDAILALGKSLKIGMEAHPPLKQNSAPSSGKPSPPETTTK